jgi:hypothetical protein
MSKQEQKQAEPVAAPSLSDILAAAKRAAEKAEAARVAASAAIAEAANPFKARMAEADELVKKATEIRNQIYAEADAIGIPRSFFGPVSMAKRTSKGGTKSGGKHVKLESLASLTEPVSVTAPKRTSADGTPLTVVYSIHAVSVTDDAGNVATKYVARGQADGSDTVREGNLTDAASLAGWHQTADVAYALAFKAGVLDQYEGLKPHSPVESILVDGQPIS